MTEQLITAVGFFPPMFRRHEIRQETTHPILTKKVLCNVSLRTELDGMFNRLQKFLLCCTAYLVFSQTYRDTFGKDAEGAAFKI